MVALPPRASSAMTNGPHPPRVRDASAPSRPSPRPPRWLRGVLFLSVLSIAGSAFAWMRVGVGGLQMHPFMVPVGLLFLLALPQLWLVPVRIRLAGAVFFVIYVLSMLQGGPGASGEAVKVGASLVTMLAIAIPVARSGAHGPVVLALSMAAALMSIKGLVAGPQGLEGVNPVDIANKNAFSLYALPALLVGGHFLLDHHAEVRKWIRWAILACMLLTLLAVFSGANRSGWLGVLLIATMLLIRGRSVRTALLLLALSAGAYALVVNFSNVDVIEHRIDLTRQGYQSDRGRQELLREALQIGVENPLLGVSPQQLPYDLARRLRFPIDAIDPHNVLGLIAGGCGILGLAALIGLGWSLWTRAPARRARQLSPAARSGHALLRMTLILWVVRGMFSREVLYSPTFAVAIGLGIALCVRAGMWRRQGRA